MLDSNVLVLNRLFQAIQGTGGTARLVILPHERHGYTARESVLHTLAEQFETNPRSVWGYVQGLTRLSQRTPWQDGRFTLDRAASRLLTTVQ